MSSPRRGEQQHNTTVDTIGPSGAQESKWEEPASAQSQSSVPSWFRPGSSNEKSQPLLPMPVQGNDGAQTPSSLGLRPSQWSIKAITLAAGGLLAAIWLVFAAFRSITGGSVPSLSTMKSSVSLEQSIFNETLGFEKIFVINMLRRPDQRDALTLMASAMNLKLEFVEGVVGADIDVKGLPDGVEKVKAGGRGDWRSNMNILRKMVNENIGSALILEDDVDFDVRIRDQLTSLATASRALVQPRLDPSYHAPTENFDITMDQLPETQPPSLSAYGDSWDILWLGHCGANNMRRADGQEVILNSNDTTVSDRSYITTVLGMYNGLVNHHDPHTRMYDLVGGAICSQAVAVSLMGAKRLLHEASMQRNIEAMDYVLNDYCENKFADLNGGDVHRCVTTQPSMFTQFRAKGATNKDSNINNLKAGKVREKANSAHLRYSTRMNLAPLFRGETCEGEVRGEAAICPGFYDNAPDPVVKLKAGEDVASSGPVPEGDLQEDAYGAYHMVGPNGTVIDVPAGADDRKPTEKKSGGPTVEEDEEDYEYNEYEDDEEDQNVSKRSRVRSRIEGR